MNESTIRRLNDLNRTFYERTSANFDESRGRAWNGWKRLLPYFTAYFTESDSEQWRVLDLGCGNGRFGLFLARRVGTRLQYTGVDNNAALLDTARESLNLTDSRFERLDLVNNALPAGDYDLVVLFGVLHHIPGADRRKALIRDAAARVAPGGMLAFTAWCFYEYERFRERIVEWSPDLEREPHDYLLDWRRGESAVRYCHYIDADEHAVLVAETGLTEIVTFRADGHTDDINRYSLLRRSRE
jgi:tRNA (uracil-5-)-methyltransferase TRM9